MTLSWIFLASFLASAGQEEGAPASPVDSAGPPPSSEPAPPEAPPSAEPPAPAEAPASKEPSAPQGPQRFRVLVLQLTGASVSEAERTSLSGLLAGALARHEFFEVVTEDDIAKMLALEGQKEVMGCVDTSCLAELAGAMGAELVVFGDLGLLGSSSVLNVSLFDSSAGRSVGRQSVTVASVAELPPKVERIADLLVARFLAAHGITIEVAQEVAKADALVDEGDAPTPWLLWSGGAAAGGFAGLTLLAGAVALGSTAVVLLGHGVVGASGRQVARVGTYVAAGVTGVALLGAIAGGAVAAVGLVVEQEE